MQICMQISQLILIFLQILFSKYFRYINSEFVYIFSFFVCWFIWKCQGLQFCKKVCKLDIIGTCKFDFKGIFGFGMMKSVYQSMITVKIVIFSNFYYFRSPPNIHTYRYDFQFLHVVFRWLIWGVKMRFLVYGSLSLLCMGALGQQQGKQPGAGAV